MVLTYLLDMAERSGRSAKSVDAAQMGRLTPAGFAAQFKDAWPTLWFVAVGILGDRNAADDVLQEAAIVALSKLSQFDPQTNFNAWMGKIVRFIALNHARRRLRTTAASLEAQAVEVVTKSMPGSEPVLNGRGELFRGHENFDDRVLSALRSLDETARACLLLRTLMDMPYKEISLALDIAEGTAMSHVHRARAVLRERLGHEHAFADRGEQGHRDD